MDRVEKGVWIDRLREDLKEIPFSLLFRYQGVSVHAMQDLRSRVRGASGRCRILKNRLAFRSIQDTDHAALSQDIRSATGLVWGEDPVALSKILVDFGKEVSAVSVVSGVLSGKGLAKNDVETLAKLPSLDVLRGQLLRTLLEPARQLVTVLQAPSVRLATVLQRYVEESKE